MYYNWYFSELNIRLILWGNHWSKSTMIHQSRICHLLLSSQNFVKEADDYRIQKESHGFSGRNSSSILEQTNMYFIRILWKNRHRKIVLQKHFIPLWLSWEKKLKWGHCHSHMATLNYALYLKSSTVRTSSTVQSSLLNCKLSFMQWVVWSSVDNLMNINDISHLKHK